MYSDFLLLFVRRSCLNDEFCFKVCYYMNKLFTIDEKNKAFLTSPNNLNPIKRRPNPGIRPRERNHPFIQAK